MPIPFQQAPRVASRAGICALLLLASGLVACHWFAPKRLSQSEQLQIARAIKRAIERAAGHQVWVKEGTLAAAPAGGAIEVLVESMAFDAVTSTIRAESSQRGLQVRNRVARSHTRGRLAEIRILRDRREVGRWQVREAPQLNRAAIVIDDLGQDLEAARQLAALPYPLTFSVLPHQRHSAEVADEAQRSGREVMLHLPMEPEPTSPGTAGDGAITVGMSSDDVARTVQADLAWVPHARGVNNHMGSRATAHAELMSAVMTALTRRHLYFVDSRTTASSVAFDVARRFHVPAFYRSVFLDDTKTTAYSIGQLREFRRLIEQQGVALAIGHPYPTTAAALEQFLPEFEKHDIQLVPVSELVRLPEVARLSPPQARTAP